MRLRAFLIMRTYFNAVAAALSDLIYYYGNAPICRYIDIIIFYYLIISLVI